MQGTISRVSVTTPRFEPFDLNIRVESEADLASLWARFNMSGEVLAEAAGRKARQSRLGAFCSSFLSTIGTDTEGKKDVWKLLHEELKKAGIRRR